MAVKGEPGVGSTHSFEVHNNEGLVMGREG